MFDTLYRWADEMQQAVGLSIALDDMRAIISWLVVAVLAATAYAVAVCVSRMR